jgi:hypothetical protein
VSSIFVLKTNVLHSGVGDYACAYHLPSGPPASQVLNSRGQYFIHTLRRIKKKLKNYGYWILIFACLLVHKEALRNSSGLFKVIAIVGGTEEISDRIECLQAEI